MDVGGRGGGLVGREPAMAALRAAFDAAVASRGQLLLVAGEPGIGKTRLVAAAAEEAAARGGLVLWGQCWEGDGAPALWPWIQVVRAGAGAGDVTAPALSADIRHTAQVPVGSEGAGGAARFRLFDAVARFLAELASTQPVVAVVDDLQWADEDSLAVLEFCARHLQARPVLLIGTYRDDEASPSLRRVAGSARIVRLGGLERDAVAALMAGLTGTEVGREVAEAVWRRTGGNPLFAVELTRLLATTASLEAVSGGGVPDSVREVLDRRLARLSQACASLLATAAVCGPETDVELLQRLCPELDVTPLVDEAVAARVLRRPEQSDGRLRFTHDLLREVLLAGMPLTASTRLHRAAAETLESLAVAGRPVHAAELASHWVAAASVDADAVTPALRWLSAAADDATARLAYADAAAHLTRAVDLLDTHAPVEPVQRTDLRIRQGDAHARAGATDRAREAYLDAATTSRAHGDSAALARAAIGIHALGAPTGLSHDKNIALLEEAAHALADQPSALRARVLAALARDLHHSWERSNLARAVEVAEDAVALAEELDDPATLAFCLLALHDARWQPGTAKHRLGVVDRMLAAATAAGDRHLVAQARLLRAAALVEVGEPLGRRELEEYCRLAESLADAPSRWGALSRRATLALLAGDIAAAWQLADRAAELGEAIGEPDAVGVRDTLRWEAARFRSEGRRAYHFDVEPAPKDYEPLHAVRLAEAGHSEEAARVLAGLDDLPALRPDVAMSHDPWPLAFTAEAAALAGSDELRERCYERLAPLSGTHVVVGGCAAYAGAVDHYLGLLGRALGRGDEARARFEAAAAQHDRLGAPAWSQLSRAEATATATQTSGTRSGLFRRDGDLWVVGFDGTVAHVTNSKGMGDLATLLARPGEYVHAVELYAGRPPAIGADAVLDEQAKAAYRRRLAEIDAAIDAAESDHDPYRADSARAERDALLGQLSAAVGLGGRDRRLGDEAERARKAVTARIREAITRIERSHPALGRHLAKSVHTGTWCTYTPTATVRWQR